MKALHKPFFFLLFVLLSQSLFAQKVSIQLTIDNIELIKGNLFIELSNDSTTFANYDKTGNSVLREVAVKAKSEIIDFKNLKPGWYAIAVFQDLNHNDTLDTKIFGIPAEPFGFSNNALARFRPPWFKDARFYYNGKATVNQEIKLIYKKPKKNLKEDVEDILE